jgi:hypothetical protein
MSNFSSWIFFWGEMQFELRASHLQSRYSAVWARPTIHFFSGYFEDGGFMNYLPGLASNCDTFAFSFQSAEIIGLGHYAWLT